MDKVELYDTTLRDGAQMEGISLSVADKIKITRKLDELGVDLHRRRLARFQPQRRGVFSPGQIPQPIERHYRRFWKHTASRRRRRSRRQSENAHRSGDSGDHSGGQKLGHAGYANP